MATFHQYIRESFGLEAAPVRLYAKVTIAGSGACTLVTANSKGVKSITHNGTGDYTVVFDQPFYAFLSADLAVQNSTGLPVSSTMGIKSVSPNTSTGATINVILSSTATGSVTATDPASGDTLWFEFVFKNSSV